MDRIRDSIIRAILVDALASGWTSDQLHDLVDALPAWLADHDRLAAAQDTPSPRARALAAMVAHHTGGR